MNLQTCDVKEKEREEEEEEEEQKKKKKKNLRTNGKMSMFPPYMTMYHNMCITFTIMPIHNAYKVYTHMWCP